MVIPLPGTREHALFMKKALDHPDGVEANILRQVTTDASNQVQEQVRKMLHTMIEVVPGQLFRDIGRFHQKFGLEPTKDPGHRLPDDVLKFRVKFLYEELSEYAIAVGGEIDPDGELLLERDNFDAEQAFDALIDLVYVALGTAFMHRFDFNAGWERVQAANMAKERATGADDPRSKRGHAADIVKPAGWRPPVLVDLLDERCPQCGGAGTCSNLEVEPDDCGMCLGTGRRRRVAPV